jgi:hypothetical protein|tara:strand:+ start:78 stop:407 length:330 start_codon:yes stop_codon:yes gene_type:complete
VAKEFNFTDDEFLDIVNKICKHEGLAGQKGEYNNITSMDESINVDRMDSLDTIVFFVWLEAVFEINEDVVTAFTAEASFTARTLKEFVAVNCTQTFIYAEALKAIEECS